MVSLAWCIGDLQQFEADRAGFGPLCAQSVPNLPPGPFQMTGPTMPYDAYTGDTIHQFFQMWQQMDCASDSEHVTRRNPTGCKHDLQSAITTTYSTLPGSTPHDSGQTMAFFNLQHVTPSIGQSAPFTCAEGSPAWQTGQSEDTILQRHEPEGSSV
jgi:hypothetical protein